MTWRVDFHPAFLGEYEAFSEAVQDEIAALIKLLGAFGPRLGRPRCDTLNGSKHANMKELRFDADNGVWRLAFAFDTERKAVLLVAGDKSGVKQDRFYRHLIKRADARFDQHVEELKRRRR
jgi:hypothetical protein